MSRFHPNLDNVSAMSSLNGDKLSNLRHFLHAYDLSGSEIRVWRLGNMRKLRLPKENTL
jgi:hypothetical protein